LESSPAVSLSKPLSKSKLGNFGVFPSSKSKQASKQV